jgi:DNA-binding IclR family transcriptional regulator
MEGQFMRRSEFGFSADDIETTAIDVIPQDASSVVKSAARVLNILEYFDEVRRSASVADIASFLGYPQSSTSVLLKTLCRLGYLDYDVRSRTFLPTARVTMLGTWVDGGPIRDGRLTQMLESLSRGTRDTIILAKRNGIFAQYVNLIRAKTSIRFHISRGSHRSLVWSGAGFVLLKDLDDSDIRALVTRSNHELALPRIDPLQVIANVREARRQGYFFSKGLVTPGAGLIAMPLPNHNDNVADRLVVAVAGPLDRVVPREKDIIDQMHAAIDAYIQG